MPHYINMTADRKGRSSVLRCLFVCFFSIFRSQNVWQAWHDRDCPFRQDKAEEDRDKREKPSAHQREWVSLMCCMCVCFWTVPKPWSHPVINFPVRHYSSLSSAVKRLHPQQAEQLGGEKKKTPTTTNCCNISTSLMYSTALSLHSLKHKPADLNYLLLLLLFPSQPSSKRGKVMPRLDFWAHEEKEAEMPQQKALSFDYHSITISYFVFR